MIFVEGFRLLFVLAGAVAGFELGRMLTAAPTRRWSECCSVPPSAMCSAAWLADWSTRVSADRVPLPQHPPGGDLRRFDRGNHGMLLGLVIGLPLLVLFPIRVLVADHRGDRLGAGHSRVADRHGQGRQIVRAAGLSRSWRRNPARPPAHALLVDSSAMMTGSFSSWDAAGSSPEGWSSPSSCSTTSGRWPLLPTR